MAAVLRYPHPDAPEVLLIRRAEDPRDPWSGHMAFPGGRRERDDGSLQNTAARETAEEVGLDLKRHGELLGRLDDVEAMAKAKRTGLIIAPFVFLLRAQDVELRLEANEVAEAVWVPLRPMMDGTLDAPFRFRERDLDLTLPSYRLDDERVVWGLTHRMLSMFFREICAPLSTADVVPTSR